MDRQDTCNVAKQPLLVLTCLSVVDMVNTVSGDHSHLTLQLHDTLMELFGKVLFHLQGYRQHERKDLTMRCLTFNCSNSSPPALPSLLSIVPMKYM